MRYVKHGGKGGGDLFAVRLKQAWQALGLSPDNRLAWTQQYTQRQAIPRPYDWVPSVVHVSRPWRTAALSNPLLWTQIAVIRRDAMIEMLRRAAGQPLAVIVTESTDIETLRWILDTYTAQLDTVVMPFIPELLSSAFAIKASRLRSLFFLRQSFTSDESGPNIAAVEAQHPLPALERLESLVCLWRPIPHFWARTLKVISLKREHELYRGQGSDDLVMKRIRIEFTDLAQALPHTPLLERLDAEFYVAETEVSLAPFELPRLEVLRLFASAAHCAWFLRFARLPTNVNIRMNCDMFALFQHGRRDQVPDALHGIMTRPATHDQPNYGPVLGMSIDFWHSFYQLRGWRALVLPLHPLGDLMPDVGLDIGIRTVDTHAQQILTTLPTQGVRALRVGPLPWSAGLANFSCVHALCTMPQLCHLTIIEELKQHEEEFPPQLACELLEETTADSVALLGVQFYGADAPHAELAEHCSSLKRNLASKHVLCLWNSRANSCNRQNHSGTPVRSLRWSTSASNVIRPGGQSGRSSYRGSPACPVGSGICFSKPWRKLPGMASQAIAISAGTVGAGHTVCKGCAYLMLARKPLV